MRITISAERSRWMREFPPTEYTKGVVRGLAIAEGMIGYCRSIERGEKPFLKSRIKKGDPMKKLLMILALLGVAGPLAAVPAKVTFQGALKQNGTPVNANKNMQFDFVDSAGATIPGTKPISVDNLQVTNGLFATQLTIDPSVNWQAYSPYIQVSVEGQTLRPNQPLTSNLYSLVAQTIVDGAISTDKLADGAVTASKLDPSVAGMTIPPGLIAMFAGPCPPGWMRFSKMDNFFPMGGASYGASAGSANSATSHGVVFGSGQGGGSFWASWRIGDPTMRDLSVTNLPPFIVMVFCVKS